MPVQNLLGDLALDTSVQEINTTLETKLPQTASNALLVGNTIQKFRFGGVNDEGFIDGVDPTEFNVIKASGDIMNNGGNAFGSSYLRIVKSVFSQDTETSITSVNRFKMPFRFGIKPSLSQRLFGQETSIELVGTDINGNIATITPPDDLAIAGTISITSNVATINFASNHNLKGGMRVILYGNSEKRLNVGPVYVTVVNSTQITVPITLANATYNAGGFVRYSDPLGNAKNVFGEIFDNNNTGNAIFWTRRNGSSARPYTAVPTQNTITSTNGIQSNTNPYTDAWNAQNETEIIAGVEDIIVFDRVIDGNNQNSKRCEFNQTLPDEEVDYKIRVRVKNNKNFVAPHCRIINIVKTGTTTATVTTDIPHGLSTGNVIQIYGVRDIVNFPNLTSLTAVASVVDSTNFTIIIGGAVTATSNGGIICIGNGSQTLQGVLNLNIQSIVRTNNILTVTLNSTATTALPGEYWTLAGLSNGAESYIGAYKVLRVIGNTIEFESIGTDFTSINTGGAVIKNTEVRIHGIVMMNYTRNIVELNNARGSNDLTNSVPVNVVNTIPAYLSPSTSFGYSAYHNLISAATTNLTSVKTSSGVIGSIVVSNNGASLAYFKLYNKASAPVLATDIPVQVYMIPAGQTINVIPGSAYGARLSTGIAYATTGLAPNTDATAVAANQLVIGIIYI